MRALIISCQKFPVPQAEFPGLLQAFAAWRERYKPLMEKFEFFVSGNGGCGIVNVPDDNTLTRIMMEFPFGLYSENEVLPICDGDTALAMQQEMIRQMMGGQG
jgi:hypothetical protein